MTLSAEDDYLRHGAFIRKAREVTQRASEIIVLAAIYEVREDFPAFEADGRRWVAFTAEDLIEQRGCFYSTKTIQRAIRSLVDKGAITVRKGPKPGTALLHCTWVEAPPPLAANVLPFRVKRSA